MVSITQLRKQIAREKARDNLERQKEDLQSEKIKLQKQLKVLKRTPAQKRNIELFKRTGRGLKILGGKAKDFTIKQAERIRKQQLRDEAMFKKRGKKIKKKSKGVGVFESLDF